MFIFSFTIKILSKMKKKIMSLATIGLVIAATVFSVSVDAKGHLVFLRRLLRSSRQTIGSFT